MNRSTAKALLLAHAELEDALQIIRRRQERVGDRELEDYPDAFSDFRYFGDQIEAALNSIEHRIQDAQDALLFRNREPNAKK